ncbi:MAG TPA: hypothetical protein ENN33_08065 [Ignavibacteria bacterium]|nr:hypothetical protein [Ignavibacteria bacterium]
MKTLGLTIIALFILIFISCSTPNYPDNYLLNNDFSLGYTNDWWTFKGMNNEYYTDIVDSISFEGSYSALISSDSLYANSFAYWGQTVSENIPIKNRLKLKVKIKLDQVEGNGVGIAIRADDTEKLEGSAEKFATTQGKRIIAGNHDWKDYEVVSDILPDDIKSATVYFLMFDSTKGKVYFDNVVLSVISE